MPNSKQTPSEIVRHFIESDGVIRNGLASGLINARALARYIQVNSHEELSFEAIVSAIHRFPVQGVPAKRLNVGRLISKISMKNEMGLGTFFNRPELQSQLAKLSGEIDYPGAETLRIVIGPKTVRVVTDSKNLDGLIPKIHKSDIISIHKNLVELVVYFSEDVLRIPGVYAALTTELAVNDVNVYEVSGDTGSPVHVISGTFHLLVEEKDATIAYQSLETLRRAAK